MKTIVHISADFPDTFAQNKTVAIPNLIDGAPEFRHVIYSLNRINGISGITSKLFSHDRICVIYKAPAYGILLRTRLDQIAAWIERDLKNRGIYPDVIHAHKFTIEGIVGLQLKERFNSSLICNIQGNTDTRVASVRRDLRPFYRHLAEQSSFILAFAPWCGPAMERILTTKLRYEVLPVGTTCDSVLAPRESTSPQLVSLFHLDHWRNKGASTMTKAVMRAAESIPDLTLDIYGSGSLRETQLLQKCIDHNSATSRVRLVGPLARDDVQHTLNRYTGFVMPSRRETYGLAFVESLFSGTPIIYPRGRAVDGILPEQDIGCGCEPTNASDVARAIKYVIDNESLLKKRLAGAQKTGALDHLRLDHIQARYRIVLTTATNQR